MLTRGTLKKAITRCLSRDLLSAEWEKRVKQADPREFGHCTIASEAFYYFSGGKQAGLKPVVCVYRQDSSVKSYFNGEKAPKNSVRSSHWWIRDAQGHDHDLTARQFREAFPYQHGHGCGFQQPQKQPSQRARILMDRVEDLLGRKALAEYKKDQIRRFRAASPA